MGDLVLLVLLSEMCVAPSLLPAYCLIKVKNFPNAELNKDINVSAICLRHDQDFKKSDF